MRFNIVLLATFRVCVYVCVCGCVRVCVRACVWCACGVCVVFVCVL